ncbi:MAG: DUF6152 family protein [Terriglobia bacterium]
MKRKIVIHLSLSLGALIVAVPMFAHHSTGNYVTGTTVTIQGTVTEWSWINPHCLLKLDVKTASGEVVHWVTETGAPANMVDGGWRKNSLKPGDQVTVTLRPAKNGKPLGSAVRVEFADGKTLQVGAKEEIGNEYHLSGAPAK